MSLVNFFVVDPVTMKITTYFCLTKKCFLLILQAFVVTLTQNHRIIHLFNIIEILNKFKIFQDY